jgi:hypothetical protein
MLGRRRKPPPPPLQRVPGGFAVNLDTDERALLNRLLSELLQLLVGPSDDPVLRRMFPPAYHLDDDAEAEVEYQRLMREELVASRLASLTTVTGALADGAVLDEAGLVAFMQAINGLRLVLGTLLDVDEAHDLDDIDDADPMVGEHHLYGYLSYLLEAAVGAVSARGTPARGQGRASPPVVGINPSAPPGCPQWPAARTS